MKHIMNKSFLNIKFIKIIGKEASSTAKVKIKLFEEIID